ncbi:uncharacterized protein [Venturia canescens]|uniref:uncharacterized protein n=1 Tax=Venturia canescens TaxID=32260 RepID=UPI001C9C776A|nr:uncharacterized protein LOC122407362 [Venturia canescens]
MKLCIAIVSLFMSVVIESKPVENANNFEVKNEIDYGNSAKDKNESDDARTKLTFRPSESSVVEPEASDDQSVENNEVTTEGSGTTKPPPPENLLNYLLPLLQRWKFTPQTFLQDRINTFKQSLGNLGLIVPSNNATNSKQFAPTNGLLQLVGLNDSGFYTDRFEPAGFLGGNGWFANKGGILGGPGAIVSTGSLLTDYPTPYKK